MAHWVNSNKKAVSPPAFVNRMATLAEEPEVSENDTGRTPAMASRGRAGPTSAQRAYLVRGLSEPGGKLPLFDREGREIARKTVESCLARGWAEPWFDNPLKPDWLVCRLTAAGYEAVGAAPPASSSRSR
jgi:hypothetical protein